MRNYQYKITYRNEFGQAKDSPIYEDKIQASALFDKTYRTAGLWRIWTDELKGERMECIKFKVVYSQQELDRMHPMMLKGKIEDYFDKMTEATQKRVLAVAKRKKINYSL